MYYSTNNSNTSSQTPTRSNSQDDIDISNTSTTATPHTTMGKKYNISIIIIALFNPPHFISFRVLFVLK